MQKQCIFQDTKFTRCVWKYGPSFLENQRKLNTVDKLFISRFYVICTTSNKWAKHAPGTHQNLTKSVFENSLFLLAPILTSKMPPKMIPKSAKMAPWASKGLLWGAMGPTRCLKPVFWLQFGTPMGLKCPQNYPNWSTNDLWICQTGTLWALREPLASHGSNKNPPDPF